MKKKHYIQPETRVVVLNQQSHILAGSKAESVGVQNYTWQNEVEE